MPPSRAIRHTCAIHSHISCTSHSRRQIHLSNTLPLTSAHNNPNPYSQVYITSLYTSLPTKHRFFIITVISRRYYAKVLPFPWQIPWIPGLVKIDLTIGGDRQDCWVRHETRRVQIRTQWGCNWTRRGQIWTEIKFIDLFDQVLPYPYERPWTPGLDTRLGHQAWTPGFDTRL